jgi:hypothetical protein
MSATGDGPKRSMQHTADCVGSKSFAYEASHENTHEKARTAAGSHLDFAINCISTDCIGQLHRYLSMQFLTWV